MWPSGMGGTVADGARRHSVEEAVEILDVFLAEPFSADARHQQRIDQVSAYERARPRA